MRTQLFASIATQTLHRAADDAAAAGALAPDSTKTKTVGDDMAQRRVFTTTTEAMAYMNKCAVDYSDFATTEIVAVGMIEVGEGDEAAADLDPKIYTDSMDVMVSVLKADKKVKAIVVAPIPKIDSILANDLGLAWLTGIIHKELNHVAVRKLRDAEDVSVVADQIPTTLEDYVSSNRDAGGGIMEAFNELYKSIAAVMAQKFPVWAKNKPVKAEMKKAFESKGYALEYWPALENRGDKGPSLFVVALQMAIVYAKQQGHDPQIFERWLATRDAKTFTPGNESDEEEIDMDALAAALGTAKTAESAPAAPAA